MKRRIIFLVVFLVVAGVAAGRAEHSRIVKTDYIVIEGD